MTAIRGNNYGPSGPFFIWKFKKMKTIIETDVVYEGKFHKGTFLFELREPVDNKQFGVINYNTIGKWKLAGLKTGDFLSAEVEYEIGPEAILIKEIL